MGQAAISVQGESVVRLQALFADASGGDAKSFNRLSEIFRARAKSPHTVITVLGETKTLETKS